MQESWYRIIRPRCVAIVSLAAALIFLVACNSHHRTAEQEDADIQRRSAEATEKLKAGAQKAAVAAKPFIKNAARRLDDVAAGVHQGMVEGAPSKPSAGRVDLNSATRSQLAALPGISNDTADAIIAGRPYAAPHQLVKKGLVTPAEYQRISSKLTAK